MGSRPCEQLNTICAASVANGEEAFSTLGVVQVIPDNEINSEAVRDADILITRSKTQITPELLRGSRIKFYGTATAGTDHIHIPYLEENNICWVSAPGGNARSVAEYVTAAMLILANRYSLELEKLTLGVAGVGNVGREVVKLGEALGMTVLKNDPPLRAATGNLEYVFLEDLIRQSDLVSLHVPLITSGKYATADMVDYRFLEWMAPGSFLINTARGEIVDEEALEDALNHGQLRGAVLDVWKNEPTCNDKLAQRAEIATPHIAGYSDEGRRRGTEMVYRSACEYFERSPVWFMERLERSPVLLSDRPLPLEKKLLAAVEQVCALERDHADFVASRLKPDSGQAFIDLRRSYRRKEFLDRPVVAESLEMNVQKKLQRLGFLVQ